MTQTDTITQLMGNSGSVIADCFRRMEIAEGQIDIAGGRRDAPKDSPEYRCWNSFQFMASPVQMTEKLFRVHAAEIAKRALNDDDLRPGTDGEIMQVLYDSSFITPLDDTASTLYWFLFNKHFPHEADKMRQNIMYESRELYKGAMVQVYDRMQRKLSVSNRSCREA